jgi:hypothetical protein
MIGESAVESPGQEDEPQMRRFSWEIQFGLSLILMSVVLYLFHYALFEDARHIILWTTTSVAFLPISVLFVTLIINRLLMRREKHLIMDKLNVLIGTFFSVIGTRLLRYCAAWDPHLDRIRPEVGRGVDCPENEYRRVRLRLEKFEYAVDFKKVDFDELRRFLEKKSDFMLRLLENPHLLEHASFTNLLRSVFHLTEELVAREGLRELPDSDYRHLAGDMERVYRLIALEWFDYMRYLRTSYPYLFSFAMRTNPFEEQASVVVE